MKPAWSFLILFISALTSFSSHLSQVPKNCEVAISFAPSDLSAVKLALKQYQKSSDSGKVVLIDDLEKSLFKNGIVIRLRGLKDSEELTLKVRGPALFPSERWKTWDTKCEQDLSPYSGRISCSINKEVAMGTLKKLLSGALETKNVIPKEFWSFAEELVGHDLSNVVLVATEAAEISIWKYKDVKGLSDKAKVVLEVWTLPNQAILSELSMKDETAFAKKRLTKLSEWLGQIKVQPVDLTPSKSEQILQFLRF